jgi:hypothetical protein
MIKILIALILLSFIFKIFWDDYDSDEGRFNNEKNK